MPELKTIYTLELHESVWVAPFTITRVPGGWIYQTWSYKQDNHADSGVFIPFNKESI